MLLGNKPNIIRQAVAAPEDEKMKKFATAIVEFSKVRIANVLLTSFPGLVFFPYPGAGERDPGNDQGRPHHIGELTQRRRQRQRRRQKTMI